MSNVASGAISGTFKLTDSGVTRAATLVSSVARLSSSTVKGVGYFLLPQPATGQTAATAPISPASSSSAN